VLGYDPLAGRWSRTQDLAVNYFAVARRQGDG
jgi:hypothetical protein